MALTTAITQRNEALPRSSTPIVRLRNLSKAYEEAGAQRTILHALDADLYTGDFIVLLGKSGSGKSTLLNLIGGIDVPSSGEIWINDTNITTLNERALTLFRRDHIGFVFQFFNLIPTLTALENVSLPFELQGKPRRQSEQRARTLLERVGLAHRADAYPDRLSGGEQQRVAIARALIHEPFLILADEPTGNLDEETGANVLRLLLELTRDEGKTLIMATHNPEVVPFADVVYHIHEGKLVAEPKA
ncbi:MAG: ABC transporter ATP-binding protein [Candidatus Thermofonsia Clade 1 bacterium]|jgi:putative ABC transport system ATP-binding protein|uniref:ABC transporter ATP-binding protein n=1 Tax=Candidatus Thermofonsia Clade 1 bacterium TaxID=2364210 RepID=A0A2M8P0Q6_9CHLR|nr:MAG: ABC transporter ATP-binding protein [Candidatus Thermofonsia Clade 1 bacterium]